MDWVNSSTTWNIHPSLAISVSMCTRVYLTTTGMEAKYGDTCQFNDSPPGTSATYCDDYRKLYLTFIIEPTQLVTYANSENYSEYMSTFETQSAVTEKQVTLLETLASTTCHHVTSQGHPLYQGAPHVVASMLTLLLEQVSRGGSQSGEHDERDDEAAQDDQHVGNRRWRRRTTTAPTAPAPFHGRSC
ncbi:uncharacterized protein LOC119376054 isoform X1 [Rhipicephalus sanguineus]|uniref:uncharacterized protein LOC119376054 isoform X1 n=1 Tax=Rhipicephalus sanguineus TaxID=34632 RepID=UPI0020C1D666|nr:uncharacterized protein LOC119376054 isoform X1 [Rhipicephalus sanguineus]